MCPRPLTFEPYIFVYNFFINTFKENYSKYDLSSRFWVIVKRLLLVKTRNVHDMYSPSLAYSDRMVTTEPYTDHFLHI